MSKYTFLLLLKRVMLYSFVLCMFCVKSKSNKSKVHIEHLRVQECRRRQILILKYALQKIFSNSKIKMTGDGLELEYS
jgi:hypothetical protein